MALGNRPFDSSTYKRVVINATSSGDNEIVAAVTDRKIVVRQYYFTMSTAVTARFESSAGGDALTGQMLQGTSAIYEGIDSNEIGIIATVAGESLNLELGGAGSAQGYLHYTEEK